MASAEKGMYIIRRINPDTLVSTMALVIHQKNAQFWEKLVLSILKVGLLRTADMTSKLEINLTDRKRTILLLIMQRMR